MPKITNADCRSWVDDREPFKTGNKTIFGELRSEKMYVVYSYGYHFPMYAYDLEHGRWLGNKDKYSRTTSKHQSQARPSEQITYWVDTTTLRDLINRGGLTDYCATRLERAFT